MKSALITALQELARVTLLAAIPVLILGVENGQVNWEAVGIAALIAALRFIDKLLHEWGKETNNKLMMRGLTQF